MFYLLMTHIRTLLRPAALLGAAALSLFAAGRAAAQDESPRGWTVTVGAAGDIHPQYPGADSYGIYPSAIFGLRREGTAMTFDAPDDSFGFGVLSRDSVVNFGPAVHFQGKRRDEDVGAAVGEVGFTVEAGGFVEVLPVRNFRIRAELRQGLGGHDGMVGYLGADLILRDENSYIFSIGPRVRWADNDYQDAYFGVNPAVAIATGLPAFNPNSGVYAVGGAAGITYRLGRNWGMQGSVGYDRLMGDASDSPIVRAFGSRDQFYGSAGLFFEFNVGR